jgi:hypothetical protein
MYVYIVVEMYILNFFVCDKCLLAYCIPGKTHLFFCYSSEFLNALLAIIIRYSPTHLRHQYNCFWYASIVHKTSPSDENLRLYYWYR